jgi:hypothetical protein
VADPHTALRAWVRWREAQRALREAQERAEAAYRRYQDAQRALAGDDAMAAERLIADATRAEREEVRDG